MPFHLYYNAEHPVQILDTMMIKKSFVTRDRGVSMSSQQLDCHGAFTFIFKPERKWYKQFSIVQYGVFPQYDFLHKQEYFKDEQEWWSPDPVFFVLDDVQRLLFRRNSPAARIHARITKRNYLKLVESHVGLLFGR